MEKMKQSFSEELKAMRAKVSTLQELIASQCSQPAAATPPHASTAASSHCGSARAEPSFLPPIEPPLVIDPLIVPIKVSSLH